MATQPVTDAERARVAELHTDGLSRAAIARELGRSPDTVGRIAADQGLTWDRTKTEVATRAKQADNASRRTQLQADLLADAERIRRQLFTPVTVWRIGGADNRYTEHTRPQPDPSDQRAIIQAVATAATTAAKLEAIDAGKADGERIDGIFDNLGAQLDALRAELGDYDGDDPD